MALKSFYTDASEIPEVLADFYQEASDGRFVLEIADIDNHPKVRGVITANRANAQKAQERLAELEEAREKLSMLPDDFDADEWQRLKAGGNTDEQIQLLRDQNAKALAALKSQNQEQIDALTQQLAERDGYIDNQTRRAALDAAIDEAGFDPIHKPLLANYLSDKIQVRRDDDGNRIAFADTDLGELTPSEFVKEFAAKQGKMYLAKPSGPGAQGSSSPTSRVGGDFGGEKADRVKAIGGMFPDLPKK